MDIFEDGFGKIPGDGRECKELSLMTKIKADNQFSEV